MCKIMYYKNILNKNINKNNFILKNMTLYRVIIKLYLEFK